MKKTKLSNINILSSIGTTNVDSITSLVKRTKQCTLNKDQYVLLVKGSNAATGYHSGIISFAKAAYDQLWISLFSIGRTSAAGMTAKTYGDTLPFYKVTWNNMEYIAIMKPGKAISRTVDLISLSAHTEAVYELINEDQLTNITPL